MFSFSAFCVAESEDNKPAVDLLPSEALLEFLLEFEDLDGEVFDMVVEKGRSDTLEHTKEIELQNENDEEPKEND